MAARAAAVASHMAPREGRRRRRPGPRPAPGRRRQEGPRSLAATGGRSAPPRAACLAATMMISLLPEGVSAKASGPTDMSRSLTETQFLVLGGNWFWWGLGGVSNHLRIQFRVKLAVWSRNNFRPHIAVQCAEIESFIVAVFAWSLIAVQRKEKMSEEVNPKAYPLADSH
ncbi:Protein of unknown function [Gryllus bimaculatus]|nr:Protein of unknown function [Gryllus bimaculatus]